MPIWLQYLLVCIVPAALFCVLSLLPKVLSSRRRQPLPHPTRAPIERLVGDLRRLSGQQDSLRISSVPARYHRLVAVELAYEDVLLECCEALELAHPGPPPLTRDQRRDVEAGLLRSGLRW